MHGTSPNFFVGLSTTLFAFLSSDEVDLSYCMKVAVMAAVGISLYELAQLWLPTRTFDIDDITATFCGATCSVLFAVPFLWSRN